MSQYREYSNPTVGESGCTYSNLTRTYGGKSANGLVTKQANYVVPKYCPNTPGTSAYPPRYNTLQHGLPDTCGGHFSFSGAYPEASCTSCSTTFTQRPCAGFLNCNGGRRS
jgi:hypothetical protein